MQVANEPVTPLRYCRTGDFYGGRHVVAGSEEKSRVMLNHVNTSVALDIGRTVLPEGQHAPATVWRA